MPESVTATYLFLGNTTEQRPSPYTHNMINHYKFIVYDMWGYRYACTCDKLVTTPVPVLCCVSPFSSAPFKHAFYYYFELRLSHSFSLPLSSHSPLLLYSPHPAPSPHLLLSLHHSSPRPSSSSLLPLHPPSPLLFYSSSLPLLYFLVTIYTRAFAMLLWVQVAPFS